MCHLSNRLYQTHRGGRWIGGREEEKERVKEEKARQRVWTERNKEKERNGE